MNPGSMEASVTTVPVDLWTYGQQAGNYHHSLSYTGNQITYITYITNNSIT